MLESKDSVSHGWGAVWCFTRLPIPSASEMIPQAGTATLLPCQANMARTMRRALFLLLLPVVSAIGPVEHMANHFLLAKAAPAPAAPKPVGLGTRMVLGALGGMGAATVCHPLDVVRVQMQIDGGGGTAKMYKNPLDATIQIVKRKGLLSGLYTGIDAAYMRQWTYGSCRVGIYAFLLNKFTKKDEKTGKNLPVAFHEKLLMGATAGSIGSVVGLPTEVALVRMSAESKLAPELRRNYKNSIDCIARIAKEEVNSLNKNPCPTPRNAELCHQCWHCMCKFKATAKCRHSSLLPPNFMQTPRTILGDMVLCEELMFKCMYCFCEVCFCVFALLDTLESLPVGVVCLRYLTRWNRCPLSLQGVLNLWSGGVPTVIR